MLAAARHQRPHFRLSRLRRCGTSASTMLCASISLGVRCFVVGRWRHGKIRALGKQLSCGGNGRSKRLRVCWPMTVKMAGAAAWPLAAPELQMALYQHLLSAQKSASHVLLYGRVEAVALPARLFNALVSRDKRRPAMCHRHRDGNGLLAAVMTAAFRVK